MSALAEQEPETTTPPAPAPAPAPVAEAERTRQEIFQYAAFIDVGDGAEECEHAHDGKCADGHHFHAWVRLPNPFQVRDIAEKAKAASARKKRMLRDKDSDAFVILESDLDSLASEEHREALVEEIVDEEFVADYNTALRHVMDMDDPDFVPEDESDNVPKLYANIQQDQEEYARQGNLPEEQRSEDFSELEKTVGRFSDALQAEMDEIQKPKRDKLNEMPLDKLIEKIRVMRIESQATEAYLHTYNTWQWFVCAYKPKEKGQPNERVFKDFNQFRYETPNDVVRALQSTFGELESRLAGDRAKNS